MLDFDIENWWVRSPPPLLVKSRAVLEVFSRQKKELRFNLSPTETLMSTHDAILDRI